MTYTFDINPRAFFAIKDGRKRVEIRANTGLEGFDYGALVSGDVINFICAGDSMLCGVKDVNHYESVRALLEAEGTEHTLSSTNDIEQGIRSVHSFPGYDESIQKNGVFAIHIALSRCL